MKRTSVQVPLLLAAVGPLGQRCMLEEPKLRRREDRHRTSPGWTIFCSSSRNRDSHSTFFARTQRSRRQQRARGPASTQLRTRSLAPTWSSSSRSNDRPLATDASLQRSCESGRRGGRFRKQLRCLHRTITCPAFGSITVARHREAFARQEGFAMPHHEDDGASAAACGVMLKAPKLLPKPSTTDGHSHSSAADWRQ